jgi:hypothetical protein
VILFPVRGIRIIGSVEGLRSLVATGPGSGAQSIYVRLRSEISDIAEKGVIPAFEKPAGELKRK